MVHYQSRAQVPAPCVGKARRPPVLQVSTIQTPREGGGPRGRGQRRGVLPPQPLAGFLSPLLREQPAWGADPGPKGVAEKAARGGGPSRVSQGTTVYYLQTSFDGEGSRGGFGPLHIPTQFQW